MNQTFGESAGPAPRTPFDPEKGPVNYNQTNYWRQVMETAGELQREDRTEVLVPQAGFRKGTTVVHMVFDKSVCPRGGLMHNMIRSASATQPVDTPRLSAKELATMNYVADKDGKLVLVNGVPIGPIYSILQYWGGERQHKRWHMSKPIDLDPNRKGDPCFMDDNMVAFVAHWEDNTKFAAALTELEHLLKDGLKDGQPVGTPRLIDFCWVE